MSIRNRYERSNNEGSLDSRALYGAHQTGNGLCQ